MSASKFEYNKSLAANLRWPLIGYGVLGGLYIASIPGKWIWFSYHPLGMLVAYITLAGNAALIKKVGGYDNTVLHGRMMTVATALSGFAYYVIYTNKETMKRKHLTTIHGKLGLAVIVGYTLLAVGGAIALHPDWGVLKKNNTFRTVHKWTGRFLTSAAWACSVLGFMTMQKNVYYQAIFGVPLLIAGFFTLL